MKSEAAAFLAKSRECLDKAQELFDAHRWPDEAGRAAYLAGLHEHDAAQRERQSQSDASDGLSDTGPAAP